jgi:hypothetical protein
MALSLSVYTASHTALPLIVTALDEVSSFMFFPGTLQLKGGLGKIVVMNAFCLLVQFMHAMHQPTEQPSATFYVVLVFVLSFGLPLWKLTCSRFLHPYSYALIGARNVHCNVLKSAPVKLL